MMAGTSRIAFFLKKKKGELGGNEETRSTRKGGRYRLLHLPDQGKYNPFVLEPCGVPLQQRDNIRYGRERKCKKKKGLNIRTLFLRRGVECAVLELQ
jgi:hypothetical protein